jgi:carbon monoxide dehydrogenase subunit G
VLELTAFEPNARWAAKVVKGPVPYEVSIQFEPSDGGTRLTTRVDGEPTGFFKVAEGMVKGQLEKSIEEDIKRLKGILEGA